MLGEVLKAAVPRPYPAVTCHVGVKGGGPPSPLCVTDPGGRLYLLVVRSSHEDLPHPQRGLALVAPPSTSARS